jgi:CheY-like chemotaxis protein
MKHILFVDDDEIVVHVYRNRLAAQGFQVSTAADGIKAVQFLQSTRPDLVILDLMMPKFTGVDVLKFIRSQPGLAGLPVILLSNSFVSELAAEAMALGVQQALPKARCTPQSLTDAINEVLSGKPPVLNPLAMQDVPGPSRLANSEPAPSAPPSLPVSPFAAPASASARVPIVAGARRDFAANAPKVRAELHALAQDFNRAQKDTEVNLRLQDFYRRVDFLSAAAGLAGAHHVSLLGSVFAALLFELMHHPPLLTPSVRRTITLTSDFLAMLLDRVESISLTTPPNPRALIVDDDPLSNRLVAAALRNAYFQARSTENPEVALKLARENQFDLVLLDIEMPGMDGLELCKRIRALPGFLRTPVIFVTGHSDFDTRAQSILSGGNDLIAKPVLPLELAVKAVTHLLRNDLENQPPA